MSHEEVWSRFLSLLTNTKPLRDRLESSIRHGCCVLCALRMLGHSAPIKELFQLKDGEAGHKSCSLEDRNEPNGIEIVVERCSTFLSENIGLDSCDPVHCCLCSGLLPHLIHMGSERKTMIDRCLEGFEFFEHSVSLHIPLSLSSKEECLVHVLKEEMMQQEEKQGIVLHDAYVPVKECLKWLATRWVRESKDGSTFSIGSDTDIQLHCEMKRLDDAMSEILEIPRKKLSQRKITGMFEEPSSELARRVLDIRCEDSSWEITCEIDAGPLWIGGRYCKFARGVSQSPWSFGDGGKKIVGSVQEFLERTFIPHFQSKKCVFSASGREDIDVRMLGIGRPFVMAVHQPKKKYSGATREALEKLEKETNATFQGLISVSGLWKMDRADLANIKDGEISKRKAYRAVVYSSKMIDQESLNRINALKDLEIAQSTPIRVLHRRSLTIRPKMIYEIHLRPLNEHYFVMDLITSAGAYVKEFVHGDFGRTKPSFRDLLGGGDIRTDILQLDVMGIIEEKDEEQEHMS
eukprot:TRINITY_DN691_c0_g2_i1.p2 TRINITY_DN691_c0_g2~~TRINITY_DN691_c0_g2_i1.p2  ORF type:complete len:520 (+),score=155.97 TRINITY_DN691_c0_g2_i1:102-1661(+)